MSSKEIEFKFKVKDEPALDAFARALGMDRRALPAKRQRNTFFDSTDGRLRVQGLALRLRTENGDATLTVKGKGVPRSGDGVLLERFEAEEAVDSREADAIRSGAASPLERLRSSTDADVARAVVLVEEALAGAGLSCLGSFENLRTTLPDIELDCGGTIQSIAFELDRTSFPHGRIDCEIEAEIEPDCDARLVGERIYRLLAEAGIDWTPADSKLARFQKILEGNR